MKNISAKQLNTKAARDKTLAVLEQMADDGKYLGSLKEWIASGKPEMRVAIRCLVELLNAKTYLEIGVWRGWGMAQAVDQNPNISAHGVDSWVKRFAGVDNPGVAFVFAELGKIVDDPDVCLYSLPSKQAWPVLQEIFTFDLIVIDGDRSTEGIQRDLKMAALLLNEGGALLVDDVVDSNEGGSLTVRQVWELFKQNHPDWSFIEVPESQTSYAVAFKPDGQVIETFAGAMAEATADEPEDEPELIKSKPAKKKRTAPASS